MNNEGKTTYKNLWDNPYTGRRWHECGACKGVVSAKAETCRHCGATFKNGPAKRGGER